MALHSPKSLMHFPFHWVFLAGYKQLLKLPRPIKQSLWLEVGMSPVAYAGPQCVLAVGVESCPQAGKGQPRSFWAPPIPPHPTSLGSQERPA